MTMIEITYTPLDDFEGWPGNPKGHDLETLKASLQRFGFVAPVTVDGASGKLVAGHGRIEALRAIRDAGGEPPERIKVVKGVWQVPTVTGVAFERPEDARAFLLADNRMVEAGGWNQKMLAEMLADMAPDDRTDLGWDQREIDDLLAVSSAETAAPKLGPTNTEQMDAYAAAEVRQITLYYQADVHDDVLRRIERLMQFHEFDSQNELFLAMLEAYTP